MITKSQALLIGGLVLFIPTISNACQNAGASASCASGTYSQSCISASCNGNKLTATCCTSCNGGDSNAQGSGCTPATITSSINVDNCSGHEVQNDNGKLVCG